MYKQFKISVILNQVQNSPSNNLSLFFILHLQKRKHTAVISIYLHLVTILIGFFNAFM